MLINKTEKQQQRHIKMLHDAKNILDECKVKNILSGSALLGIIRDNDLIPWQYGIVLIVFIEDVIDKTDTIIHKLKEKKFNIIKCFQNKKNWKIRANKKNLIIEIVGYFKNKDMYQRQTKKRIREIPEKFLNNCTNKIKIRNCEFIIPNYPEELLTHLYDDWKIPIRSEYAGDFRSKNHCRRIDK